MSDVVSLIPFYFALTAVLLAAYPNGYGGKEAA